MPLAGENAWFFPVGDPDAVRAFLAEALREPELRLYYVREEDRAFAEWEFPGRFRFDLRPGDGEYLYDWAGLDARGVLVYVDGVPRSVTAGYPLSGDTFDLSLSKQNVRLSGLAVYSRWMLIRSLPERYSLLNGEEDLGLEGLRRMKRIMRPIGRVEMYEGRA